MRKIEFKDDKSGIKIVTSSSNDTNLIDGLFTNLNVLRYTPICTPMPYSSTQILGILISNSDSSRYNLCGLIPLTVLDTLCGEALTIDNLKVSLVFSYLHFYFDKINLSVFYNCILML